MNTIEMRSTNIRLDLFCVCVCCVNDADDKDNSLHISRHEDLFNGQRQFILHVHISWDNHATHMFDIVWHTLYSLYSQNNFNSMQKTVCESMEYKSLLTGYCLLAVVAFICISLYVNVVLRSSWANSLHENVVSWAKIKIMCTI